MVFEKVRHLIEESADNRREFVGDLMDTTQASIDDVTDLKPMHATIGLVTGVVSDVADYVKDQAEIVRGLSR